MWEEEAAETLNGSVVKYSGRLEMHKGDVVAKDILGDCKYTDSPSYSLSYDMWEKLSSWAINEGKRPAIFVRLPSCDICVVQEDLFAELGLEFPAEAKQKSKTPKSRSIGAKPCKFKLGMVSLIAFPFPDLAEKVSSRVCQ